MILNLAALVRELDRWFGSTKVRVSQLVGYPALEILIDQGRRDGVLVTLSETGILVPGQMTYSYHIDQYYGAAFSLSRKRAQEIEDVIVRALNKSISDQKYGRVYEDQNLALWWH